MMSVVFEIMGLLVSQQASVVLLILASEVAQWLKMLATKPHDLRIPETYTMEGEDGLL